MAHGKPDWGMVGPKQTVYGLDDLGEAVVRLGSPVIFDRRGDVVFMDDFERGFTVWEIATAGVGSAVYRSVNAARGSGVSCQITVGGVAGATARILTRLSYPVLSNMGLEVAVTVGTLSYRIDFYLGAYTGAQYVRSVIRYERATGNLYYLDATGAYILLAAGVNLGIFTNLYHIVKLVVDLNANAYIRAIVDSTQYDLRGIPIWVTANVTAPHAMAMVYVHGDGANAATINVDDVIITQNEPY